MNAYTFDRYSVPCPNCHRSSVLPSVKMVRGLLTCPHCRSRFVVSMSGHYVRDPFAKSLPRMNSKMLRRQSRPLARMMRDTGISKHSPLIALVSGLVAIGFTLSLVDSVSAQKKALPNWMQQIVKLTQASD